jgi:hypothetical protein
MGRTASGEIALVCHASSATPQEAIDVANDSAKAGKTHGASGILPPACVVLPGVRMSLICGRYSRKQPKTGKKQPSGEKNCEIPRVFRG